MTLSHWAKTIPTAPSSYIVLASLKRQVLRRDDVALTPTLQIHHVTQAEA